MRPQVRVSSASTTYDFERLNVVATPATGVLPVASPSMNTASRRTSGASSNLDVGWQNAGVTNPSPSDAVSRIRRMACLLTVNAQVRVESAQTHAETSSLDRNDTATTM